MHELALVGWHHTASVPCVIGYGQNVQMGSTTSTAVKLPPSTGVHRAKEAVAKAIGNKGGHAGAAGARTPGQYEQPPARASAAGRESAVAVPTSAVHQTHLPPTKGGVGAGYAGDAGHHQLGGGDGSVFYSASSVDTLARVEEERRQRRMQRMNPGTQAEQQAIGDGSPPPGFVARQRLQLILEGERGFVDVDDEMRAKLQAAFRDAIVVRSTLYKEDGGIDQSSSHLAPSVMNVMDSLLYLIHMIV